MVEVEWICELPERDGESDFDRARYRVRYFTNERRARTFARKIAGDSPLGVSWLIVGREATRREAMEWDGPTFECEGREWVGNEREEVHGG